MYASKSKMQRDIKLNAKIHKVEGHTCRMRLIKFTKFILKLTFVGCTVPVQQIRVGPFIIIYIRLITLLTIKPAILFHENNQKLYNS